MPHELKVPEVGESVQEVQIGQWLVAEGDRVEKDQNLVEIETDKASLELPAPAAGVLTKITKRQGEPAEVGDVIGLLEAGEAKETQQEATKETEKKAAKTNVADEDRAVEADAAKMKDQKRAVAASPAATTDAGEQAETKKKLKKDKKKDKKARKEEQKVKQNVAREPDEGDEAEDGEAVVEEAVDQEIAAVAPAKREEFAAATGAPSITPAARRLLREHGLTAGQFASRQRVTQEDVLAYVDEHGESKAAPDEEDRRDEKGTRAPADEPDGRPEEIVPMSLLRKRIARRLVEAQQTAAILTTFNEIDMTAVMELRREHKQHFQQTYGVKLGIMSFFVKAAVEALKEFPAVNAEIRDDKIVYKHYYDIGVAIGGGKGLVVPVLRNAESLSFAEIEKAIADFARRAESGELKPDELEGGTFTISNGGVYGSLLSTPILNPPQSGILGLHAIQDRPVAKGGQVVIRPMMYAALSYDHRLVDGREAVSFLRRVKETIEEPARVMLEI